MVRDGICGEYGPFWPSGLTCRGGAIRFGPTTSCISGTSVMVRDGICGELAHGLKNICSHFKLILCCFLPNISPYTKFHPNQKKNTEIENCHYWSVLVGRAGRLKNGRRHFKRFVCCFQFNISLHTKFNPNWTKNTVQRSPPIRDSKGTKNFVNYIRRGVEQ